MMVERVGIIGLGIMGGAMARNLLAAGVDVIGYDVAGPARQRLAEAGGQPATSVAEVVRQAGRIITSVATTTAFEEVMNQIAESRSTDLIVVDTSTMPLDRKEWAQRLLTEAGVTLLDCPISGTGAQAETRDLVFLASGDPAAIDTVRSTLAHLGRVTYDLGPFGSGSKMKYIANLLVGIHNAAAAEAMVLAEKGGIDPHLVLEVLYDSAATSRMFQLRFPLMIDNRYSPPTAKVSMFVKDLDIIEAYAASVGSPTPLLAVVAALYDEAQAFGLDDEDAASICAVLETRAGIRR